MKICIKFIKKSDNKSLVFIDINKYLKNILK